MNDERASHGRNGGWPSRGDTTPDVRDDVDRVHPTRILVPLDVADWLRLILALPFHHDAGLGPVRVDAEAFADWCLLGMGVCHVSDDAAEPWTPVLRAARSAAEEFVLRLTIRRHAGNISHAAASGKTSRRAFREGLKKHNLYFEGAIGPSSSEHPRVTWKTVSFLSRMAATTHDPERAVWERAANVGIHRIRQAGRRASSTRARQIMASLSQGMTNVAVATVIPGPLGVSLVEGRVRIDIGGETTDTGPVGSYKALAALTRALVQLGGPAEGAEI